MYTVHLLEESGMSGLVWIVLIIFLIMVFLGWLAVSKGWLKKEAEPQPVEHRHEEPVASVSVESKSAAVKTSMADDLTVLEGIGPKVAMLLAGIGISTFESLAKADHGKVKTALDAAGYKYMDSAGWIEQAALAAKGDTEGLKKLQDSLKGGRKA